MVHQVTSPQRDKGQRKLQRSRAYSRASEKEVAQSKGIRHVHVATYNTCSLLGGYVYTSTGRKIIGTRFLFKVSSLEQKKGGLK